MKKTWLLFSLVFPSVAWAQSDKIETTLDQFPAADAEHLRSALTELNKSGEAGILELVAGLNQPGDHSRAEYALWSYSAYVAKGNHPADRLRSSLAYQKALKASKDPEAQAFLITQLQLVGKDETVPTLATYLSDERLADPVARALVSINTPAAQKAIASALPASKGAAQLAVLEAAGKMRIQTAQPLFLKWAKSPDLNVRKLALYGLANLGFPSAQPLLLAQASKVHYEYDPSEATNAYLLWLKRAGENPKQTGAEKNVLELIKSSKGQTRLAAEQIVLEKASKAAFTAFIERVSKSDYSAADKFHLLKQAMEKASTTEQKRVVLKELAQVDYPAALYLASTFLETKELQKTAATTVAELSLDLPELCTFKDRELISKTFPFISSTLQEELRKHLSIMPELYGLKEEEKKEGFKTLFDGSNLEQWTGNKQDYIIEEGNLVIRPSGKGQGNLYTKDEYADFVFRFDFQLTPGANNGLGVRAPLEGDAAYTGMELQILDNDAFEYKNLQPYQYHGSVYGIIPAKREAMKPVGEWNSEEVTLKGTRVKVVLNGVTILDGDTVEATKEGTPDHKEHPGLKRTSGHIGFLGHGSVVKFRNMRVKEL
ncbi:family 16 glycoside hydrolase [Siphonobacter sp. SORGH_AS_1065]|uniref:family 16 glycoside hydrolase n=1 Tax=Siphonobacter sp. SORGH_AS_1065 TaxID=3041795 RepID=UPI0027870AEC|nr:family 16 glycoside hydrolase [Siphonobacter sp. SORGH_AS_1065]MDQ1090398.1 hypothetical protein [Siphonobacter sp. SORGH_AS_1065]